MNSVHIKYIVFSFCIAGLILVSSQVFPVRAGSARYVDFSYVGTETGASSTPYNTMNEAVQASAVGDIIYIKANTYTITPANKLNFEVRNFSPATPCSSLTAANSLKITADPANSSEILFQMNGAFGTGDVFRIINADCIWFDGANRIKFDGTGATFANNTRSLVFLGDSSENMIFENTEVRDADQARGLSFYNHAANPANITVRNNYVHHTFTRALGGFAKGALIQGNLIEYGAMANANNALCCNMGGWPGVIQTAYDYQDYAYSQNIDIINNTVRNSWGEGIAVGFVIGGNISGNRVYDTYSMNIYIDNAQSININNNYIYSTNPAFYRSDKGTAANGIGFATENYNGTPPNVRTQNITISNNLMVNVGRGISYFHDTDNTTSTNTYDNIKVFHNVIKGVQVAPVFIEQVTMGTAPANTNEVRNNILYLGPGNTGNTFGNAGAWNASNNQFVNYNDSSNQPRFKGSSLNAGDPVDNFKLASASPNINAGISTSISTDYFGNSRFGNPDIGLHEYDGVSNTIYYVDSAAGNDANSGMSPAAAWQTMAKVSNHSYGQGDQILFKSGQTFGSNWTMIINGNGVSSNRITVGTYGGTAKVKIKNTDSATPVKPIIDIAANWVDLKDIELPNDSGPVRHTGLKVSGSNNRISNLEIYNIGHAIYNLGDDNLYFNNNIHDLLMIVNDAAADNDYGAVGVLLGDGSNNIIIRDNTFLNLSPNSIDYGKDGSAVELFGQVQNTQFYNNILTNVETVSEIGSWDTSHLSQNIVYHHNLVVNTRRFFVFHNAPTSGYGLNIDNVKIENNTLVKTSLDTDGFVLGFTQNPSNNSFYFRNNIAAMQNLANFSLNAGTVVHTHNLYHFTNVGGQIYALDPTELQADPLFIGSGDYKLQSSSPAIDSATGLGYTTDKDGTAIPFGSGPDRGAYEKIQIAVSISMQTDGTINFGQRPLGATIDTTSSGVNDVQQVRVDTGPANLLIKTSNFNSAGGDWTFANTIGNDQAVYEFSLDGNTWFKFVSADTNISLQTNQVTNQVLNIYFRLTLPSVTGSVLPHSTTTTITAVSP